MFGPRLELVWCNGLLLHPGIDFSYRDDGKRSLDFEVKTHGRADSFTILSKGGWRSSYAGSNPWHREFTAPNLTEPFTTDD